MPKLKKLKLFTKVKLIKKNTCFPAIVKNLKTMTTKPNELLGCANSFLPNDTKCIIIHIRPRNVTNKSNLFLLLCQYPFDPSAIAFIAASIRNKNVKIAANVANGFV